MLFNLKLIPFRYILNTLILSAAYMIGVIVFNLKLQINIAAVNFMQDCFDLQQLKKNKFLHISHRECIFTLITILLYQTFKEQTVTLLP